MANPQSEGSAVAEAAGGKALRTDALQDRATNPRATAERTHNPLGEQALQQEKTAVKPLCKEGFRDKLMGMLLMGAYADALGAAHELKGLAGATAVLTEPPTAKELALKTYSTYGRDNKSEPYGVWIKAEPGETGIVTDDTSVRLMMLHQWLSTHAFIQSISGFMATPTESGFEAWLAALLAEPSRTSPTKITTLLNTRKNAISALTKWLGFARGTEPYDDTFIPRFWKPGIPVAFGQFFYLELAAIYGCCDRDKVFTEFSTFSILDQDHARFSTGLLAAMLATAVCAKGTGNFTDFFHNEVAESLKLAAAVDPSDASTLAAAWKLGKKVGTDNAGKSLNEVLQQIRTEIYAKHALRIGKGEDGLGKFDPALFLAQMTAAVQWGAGKPKDMLNALTFGAGDSDTIPSQLGSIMGAYFGESALRSAGFTAAFDTVNAMLEKYFVNAPVPGTTTAFKLGDVADVLELLASRVGCCNKAP